MCGTSCNCAAVAWSTPAAEPNRSSRALVSRGPMPGTRWRASRARASADSAKDMDLVHPSGERFFQDTLNFRLGDVVDQGHFAQAARQDQAQPPGKGLLIAVH